MVIKTECGYYVPEDTQCNGSHRVPKHLCETCKVYTKYPTQTSEKRVVVKVHAFGVTVTAY